MSLDSPKVTVLMSVYNGEKFLVGAIESILNQTYRDFEFIIIDDGSTDGTAVILARYQQMDNRIHAYNQENQGLIASLNRGCELAKGKYIARMDADDISMLERLAKQVQYMESHPEIGVLGTWIQWIDENSKPGRSLHPPTAPGTIGWFLIFENCLAHPSVVMRADVIKTLGFYHREAIHAEDYELWTRVIAFSIIANIPETLLQLRVWNGSISSRHSQTQELTVVKASHEMIRRLLGPEVSAEAAVSVHQVVMGQSLVNHQQIEQAASLIRRLYRAYLNTSPLNRMEAREVAHDAGKKLYTLAWMSRRISVWKSFAILIDGLKLNHHLLATLFTDIIAKVKSRLMGRG